MLGTIKTEGAGLLLDVWRSFRGVAASKTFLVGIAAIAAPYICNIIGCNVVKAEHAIAIFLGWAVKQAAKEHGVNRKDK